MDKWLMIVTGIAFVMAGLIALVAAFKGEWQIVKYVLSGIGTALFALWFVRIFFVE